MRTLEVTRAGVLGTLGVLAVAGICIYLGTWQLDRRQGRLAHNAAVTARMDAPPVTIDHALADTAGLSFRRAIITGEYDSDRSIVLAGRSHDEMPGVHLFSPLRLAGGAILVNRGWVPSVDAATIDVDRFRRPGPVRLEGVLLPFPAIHVPPRGGGFRTRWFRLAGDDIRGQYPYPVAPLYLLVTSPPAPLSPAAADARADGAERGGRSGSMSVPELPIRADPPELTGGPHLSYAIQWFSFATIFVVGWIVVVMRRADDAEGEAGKRSVP